MPNIQKDVLEQFRQSSKRLIESYKKLPTEQQQRVRKLFDTAHKNTLRSLGKAGPETAEVVEQTPRELALAATALDGKSLEELIGGGGAGPEATEEAIFTPPIDGMGNIIWTDKYQIVDPGWLDSVAVWLDYMFDKHDFPTVPAPGPAPVTIPDDTTIVLVGDWGTGSYGDSKAPSLQVADQIKKLKPDYTIHLGDVYYAGTPDTEAENFLPYWVPGTKGSFGLNSNHAMMAGGQGYFTKVLTDPSFSQQGGLSYFALENENWIIIGLDTSYHSDYWKMYGPGNLDSVQLDYLKAQTAAAHSAGKQIMLLSHQNALTGDGGSPEDLWGQVTAQLPTGASGVYWYWGHVHVAAVYAQQQQNGIQPRCCGHGAIPWGLAKDLAGLPWYENTPSPDPPQPSYEIMNGFALLTFTGATLKEQFIDQTGGVSWPSV